MRNTAFLRYLLAGIVLFAFTKTSFSQQDTLIVNDTLIKKDTVDYYDMSIEQLQKLKAVGVSSDLEKLINSLIGVASKKPLSGRESPSIVSLITKEEIRNSGARDLIDVLNMIPGVDFGVDVEGIVGIGIRGNWAHEGKILLLLDGQEMNEVLFGTTQFGNHFPIDQIKKIEVIRGPGSAIYGGYAEYGVINIITFNGEDINGVNLSGTYGQMSSTYARRNVSLSAGRKINGLNLSVAGFLGEGKRSDQIFEDAYGGIYDMKQHSSLNSGNLNVGLSYKEFSTRFIHDRYDVLSADGYDAVKLPYWGRFHSTFCEMKYNFKIREKLTITPKINYKHQVPWRTDGDSLTDPYYKIVDRYTGNLNISYNYNRKLNFTLGGEVYNDRAEDRVDSSYYADEQKKVSYLNTAIFAQALIKLRLINIITGARFDNHNVYGSSFVPRVGLTKKIEKFHFKLLYSNAFRAPTIENINLTDSTGMRPERTSVAEFEAGFQITRKSIVTINLFDITTKGTIVYYVDPESGNDAYHNVGSNGSRGAELELKLKDDWGYTNLNYSFYTVAGKGKIEDYSVPQNSTVLLAFPAHRVNLNSSFNITRSFSISPSVIFQSDRYAYTGVDSLGEGIVEKLPAAFYANLFLRYENVIKGLDIGIGVYNIFDERVRYIQPYNSLHNPLPGPSREFVFKLTYRLNFKKKEVEHE
jgi:outer membrane receptor for ferrienterochelin and colicin